MGAELSRSEGLLARWASGFAVVGGLVLAFGFLAPLPAPVFVAAATVFAITVLMVVVLSFRIARRGGAGPFGGLGRALKTAWSWFWKLAP